jgi:hypothetical protein
MNLKKLARVLEILSFIRNRQMTSNIDIRENVNYSIDISKSSFHRYIDKWVKSDHITKEIISKKLINLGSTPKLEEFLEKLSKITNPPNMD